MTIEELQKAIKENGTVAIAHLVWNDLLVAYAKFILEIAGTITFIVSAITVIYFGPHQISKIWTKNDK